jgi:hypothetical protein
MADLIYQLILAAILLVLLPQLAGWGVSAIGVRRGSWGPILVAIVIAPLVYWLLASQFYAPGGHSMVQFTDAEAGGPIEVNNLQSGMLAHGVGALILQVFRLVRGR